MKKISESQWQEAIHSAEYVILEFSSPGCAPCKKVPAVIEAVLNDLSQYSIDAFEVDVSEEPGIAQKYFVLGVPTVVILKKGSEIKRFNSVPAKEKIVESIQP